MDRVIRVRGDLTRIITTLNGTALGSCKYDEIRNSLFDILITTY
jgi:hypothetical protein